MRESEGDQRLQKKTDKRETGENSGSLKKRRGAKGKNGREQAGEDEMARCIDERKRIEKRQKRAVGIEEKSTTREPFVSIANI